MRRSCLSPTHCLSHHCATPGFRLASGPHGNRTRIAAESDPRGDGFQRDPLSLTPPPLTPTLSPLRGAREQSAADTPPSSPRPSLAVSSPRPGVVLRSPHPSGALGSPRPSGVLGSPRPAKRGEGQGEGSPVSPRIALGHPADRIR